MYNPYDFYFKKAKKTGYKARSAFKLEEIQQKYGLITPQTKNILDIGCAPGSWIQYSFAQLKKNRIKDFKIIWLDIKPVELNFPEIKTYVQDITDTTGVQAIFDAEQVQQFDFIQSDMAPNTIGLRDIDAIRSLDLIQQSYWIYEQYLNPQGSFAIKLFMGPGFDEFIMQLKKRFWGKYIKVFKPESSRKQSKETYVIKIPEKK